MSQLNIPTVFTTSGFILPLTPYHAPYSEVNGAKETIFTQFFASTSDQMLHDYFKNSNIYISDTAKKIYDAYTSDPTHEHFIDAVNLVTDILQHCTPEQFFKWQMGSPHISAISVMFCKDIVTGKFVHNYNTYNVLGFNSRFSMNNALTATQASERWADMKRAMNNSGTSNSWTTILVPLMAKRAVFMTFFKHIFVDFY